MRLLGAFVFIVLGALVHSAACQAAERPNIIFFLADDLGWTGLGCFGSDFYETPNLDALAADGIKFSSAYSACTVCSPTRASIMTGMYPARLRLTDFIAGQNRPFAKMSIPDWTRQLDSEQVTIAEVLRDVGYRTAHIGKWHLSPRGAGEKGMAPTDQGFDVSYSGPTGTKGYFLKQGTTSSLGTSYLTDALTDRACQFIDESKDDPFFLYFAYNVPHTPIQGREDLVKYFTKKLQDGTVHNHPTYAAMVASLDQSVGRVLSRIENLGLSNDTIVIFTSDNGGLTQRYGKHDGFTENLPLRRGKGSAYEGGVRVPTMIRWPGVTKPGQVCDIPIMTIDYFPTILEMVGVSSDQKFDGTSILPLLKDVNASIDRSLFWHYPHYHAGGDGPYSAIRSGEFRLVEFHEDNRLELYNLASDIGEKENLASKFPETASSLLSELNRWRESVGAQMPTPNPNYDPTRSSGAKSKAKP